MHFDAFYYFLPFASTYVFGLVTQEATTILHHMRSSLGKCSSCFRFAVLVFIQHSMLAATCDDDALAIKYVTYSSTRMYKSCLSDVVISISGLAEQRQGQRQLPIIQKIVIHNF
jgi:hypothetical protein